MSESPKDPKKYINYNLLKVSYWVIASLAIIHLDTFTSLMSINEKNKLIETKNLAYLSVFMLFSILFLKIFKHIAFILITYIQSLIFGFENSKKEGVLVYKFMNYAIDTNNIVAYKHYEKKIEEVKERGRLFEFFCYFFLIASLNLWFCGSLYDFLILNKIDNIEFLILFGIILSLIFGKYSFIEQHSINIDDMPEIESYMDKHNPYKNL